MAEAKAAEVAEAVVAVEANGMDRQGTSTRAVAVATKETAETGEIISGETMEAKIGEIMEATVEATTEVGMSLKEDGETKVTEAEEEEATAANQTLVTWAMAEVGVAPEAMVEATMEAHPWTLEDTTKATAVVPCVKILAVAAAAVEVEEWVVIALLLMAPAAAAVVAAADLEAVEVAVEEAVVAVAMATANRFFLQNHLLHHRTVLHRFSLNIHMTHFDEFDPLFFH